MIWTKGWKLQRGKYTVRQQLGTGGFGITYRVRDLEGNQFVVKALNENLKNMVNFPKIEQDFLNESLRLAKCYHPNIVQVYEIIQENNSWCIVMEYINGEDLGKKISRRGMLSENKALKYIFQIGEALTYIHNLHPPILHRDLKPPNIMVRHSTDQAILIDFGIAREFVPNFMGLHTPLLTDGFAPIEQYDKLAKRGAYTDIYALSATLYSLVTGQIPTPAPARNLFPLAEPRIINPAISSNLNKAIMIGMRLKPNERPQSMREWLSLLGNKSQTGYSKLESLLKSHNWLEADRETWNLMLKIAGRNHEKWLDVSQINNFPCEELIQIDRLWNKYSNGHFGFSVQNKIWQKIGGNYYASDDTWKNFGYLVGWRKNRAWVFYEGLNFSLNSPSGMLPRSVYSMRITGRKKRFASLMIKLGKC
ncbi:serine/threonine-protein kinase [Limnospira platensis]|uniref:serine/threonine-protein kinase n=1 Tax=Limnospira platensis TaxID=118562 RepID=UPI000280405E|nr:serine/threonine protein kinase [Arthrospira platensis C1]UWU51014.1 Serine/threonine protein kinase [Arthrospira platensis C1]